MSHADPMILDTPEKVAAANALRERIDADCERAWRLGDHCWYDVGTVNHAISRRTIDAAKAVAP